MASVNQLHLQRELLIPRDQRVRLFAQSGIVIRHTLQDHHLLADHPVRVGKPPGGASDFLPSRDHTFGQGKARGWFHGAERGGQREARQWP